MIRIGKTPSQQIRFRARSINLTAGVGCFIEDETSRPQLRAVIAASAPAGPAPTMIASTSFIAK